MFLTVLMVKTATACLIGSFTQIRKTGAAVKVFGGTCVTCKRNKSPILSDRTVQAERLEDFSNC